MEPRLSMITLGVADLQRAVSFYERTVGWKVEDGPPGVAFFALGGTVFSLFPFAELDRDAGQPPSAEPRSSGFALAYCARSGAEVDAIFARLRERGAQILKQPQAAPWGGYHGYFADPDGHRWDVAHNPFWTVLEDGRIAMRR